MGRDPELRRWVKEQDLVFLAVRRKLSANRGAERFARENCSARPIEHADRQWLRPALQIAAVLLVLACLTTFWLRSHPKNNFAAYEGYVTRLVWGNIT